MSIMNDRTSAINLLARSAIKEGLLECTEQQQIVFKQMYSPGSSDLPIDEVVDKMDADKLGWALQQVENTRKLINPCETDG